MLDIHMFINKNKKVIVLDGQLSMKSLSNILALSTSPPWLNPFGGIGATPRTLGARTAGSNSHHVLIAGLDEPA
ncbi:hypothetical protein [Pseudomonas benzenivorans]|uniref:Uncharacterized protein n=1 Tax=Pseudomonas benzenivorans TaxID=556533 RepID=A0ABY5HAN4_9PSED|nr:hypothetical protein [Pseudomonas benzenivorans]UTW08076.1 hypothetical protein KDW96_01710 [Pseudomonas benzenivorans]